MFFISCDSGCSVDENDFADKFELHLQHNFENTYVHILIDDETVFGGEVNTDARVSLAAVISLNMVKGAHKIKVYSDGSETDTSFTVPDTMVIGIVRDFYTGKISFTFYYPPNLPVYD